mmetsp:Transcript_7823/g.19317  ORF Transcript_7823/g.19317 Transcript_7823/m.19317 type:complete len:105 (+) Transcript_7823:134-448(+)
MLARPHSSDLGAHPGARIKSESNRAKNYFAAIRTILRGDDAKMDVHTPSTQSEYGVAYGPWLRGSPRAHFRLKQMLSSRRAATKCLRSSLHSPLRLMYSNELER